MQQLQSRTKANWNSLALVPVGGIWFYFTSRTVLYIVTLPNSMKQCPSEILVDQMVKTHPQPRGSVILSQWVCMYCACPVDPTVRQLNPACILINILSLSLSLYTHTHTFCHTHLGPTTDLCPSRFPVEFLYTSFVSVIMVHMYLPHHILWNLILLIIFNEE